MQPFKRLSAKVSVSPWLTPADFEEVKALGFRTVLNFRPDGEADGQISSVEAQAAAEAAGLAYVQIPATPHNLFAEDVVNEAERAFERPGPILAYCASGLRAAIIWAAASARRRSVTDVLSSLDAAGLRLRFLRDDLDAQADRSPSSSESRAAMANSPAPVKFVGRWLPLSSPPEWRRSAFQNRRCPANVTIVVTGGVRGQPRTFCKLRLSNRRDTT